jgi:hypothetical protein
MMQRFCERLDQSSRIDAGLGQEMRNSGRNKARFQGGEFIARQLSAIDRNFAGF